MASLDANLRRTDDSLDTGESNWRAPTAFSAKRAMATLLVFVCFAQFLPSEPFLTDLLYRKGFNHTQIVHEIFPLWIDFRLPVLLVIGVLSECIGSSNMILLGSLCGCATVAITSYCSSLFAIQLTQLTVAISMGCHDAPLYSLVFELSAIIGSGYQAHIHWIKSCLVFSNFLASISGGLLLEMFRGSYILLWQVSLLSQLISLVVAVLLVFRARHLVHHVGSSGHGRALTCNCRMWVDVLRNFTFQGVVEWQFWSISMHIAHLTVATYWQSLVRSKAHRARSANGFANALSFLFGLIFLFAFAKVSLLSKRDHRWWIIASSLFVAGICVFSMGVTVEAYQFYCCYVVFQVVYRLSGAISVQQVGAEIRERAERPRLALQFSLSELLSAFGQVVVQFVFDHWMFGKHDGGKYSHDASLARRFEALGIGLCFVAILFMITWVVVGLGARRQRC